MTDIKDHFYFNLNKGLSDSQRINDLFGGVEGMKRYLERRSIFIYEVNNFRC